MAQKASRGSRNSTLNSSFGGRKCATKDADKLQAISEAAWNTPGAEEDEAVYRALMRAQESSIRRFWGETKDDNL